MSQLIESDADSICAVVKFSFPPQRGFIIKDDFLIMQYPEHLHTFSQHLEPIYHDTGQFIICKVNKFLRTKKMWMERMIPYVLFEMEVQDIDNEDDWKLAEIKYKFNYTHTKN